MKQKKIKNYTTTLGASRHLAEIQESLIEHGAVGIQMMYDGERRISSVQFAVPFKNGRNVSFALPCEWRKFQQVLKNQGVKRWDEDEYAYRVAWANLKDWVLAQMALYESEMVDMPQIFLPFAVKDDGHTLYEAMMKTPELLLGNGN